MPINIVDLNDGFTIYGNKGDVHKAECHIQQNGKSETMCGRPMLAHNSDRLRGDELIACGKCILVYNELMEKWEQEEGMFGVRISVFEENYWKGAESLKETEEALMVAMSLLSDSQEMIERNEGESARQNINLAKYYITQVRANEMEAKRNALPEGE